MNKAQLIFHHIFRFIWNLIFIVSYPILASFGILFIGVTYLFSLLSKFLARLRPEGKKVILKESEWENLPHSNNLFEAKLVKHIVFGPSGYQLRRKDGVPSIVSDFVFGQKVRLLEGNFILEKWNSTDPKELPDFDICLYNPDEDSMRSLTNIKCFDWHVSDVENNILFFKWFDGTQGGEVKVAL